MHCAKILNNAKIGVQLYSLTNFHQILNPASTLRHHCECELWSIRVQSLLPFVNEAKTSGSKKAVEKACCVVENGDASLSSTFKRPIKVPQYAARKWISMLMINMIIYVVPQAIFLDESMVQRKAIHYLGVTKKVKQVIGNLTLMHLFP